MCQITFPHSRTNIGFEVNNENTPPYMKMRQWQQIYKVKRIPKTIGSIKVDVQSVIIHSCICPWIIAG